MAQEQPSERQEETKETSASVERAKPQGLAERRERAAMARPEWSSPFSVVRRLMEDMDRMFSGFGFDIPLAPPPITAVERPSAGGFMPVIETMERDGRLVFRADLPGLGPDDVKVEVVGDELVISGERKQEQQQKKRGRFYSERRYGSFERRITLPEDVDPESVEATFENGVLEVSLPLPPEQAGPRTRKIEIKSHEKAAQTEPAPGSIH